MENQPNRKSIFLFLSITIFLGGIFMVILALFYPFSPIYLKIPFAISGIFFIILGIYYLKYGYNRLSENFTKGSPSKLWYFLLIFSRMNNIYRYFLLKKRDEKMAKKVLIISFIISFIAILAVIILIYWLYWSQTLFLKQLSGHV